VSPSVSGVDCLAQRERPLTSRVHDPTTHAMILATTCGVSARDDHEIANCVVWSCDGAEFCPTYCEQIGVAHEPSSGYATWHTLQ
jgi:hypothetical protein